MAVTKKKNPKNISIMDVADWKFDSIVLSQEWNDHLGEIPKGANILVTGDAKNGKTEYLIKMACAFMAAEMKVSFNSAEQGKSKSLQMALLRNNIQDHLTTGKFILCEPTQRKFENWYRRLASPNSGHVVFLDSADYMDLTVDQMKLLFERFKNKIIIIVTWKVNPNLKKFKHLVDVIIDVKDYKAEPAGRFGGWKTFTIWDKKETIKSSNQISMF